MSTNPIIVEGLTFTEHCSANENIWLSRDLVLKLDAPHPNKVNRVGDEARILEDLTKRGAACVPRFHSQGLLDTRPYLIMERVHGDGKAPSIAILHAFEQLMGFGYLHGDLKDENVIWNVALPF